MESRPLRAGFWCSFWGERLVDAQATMTHRAASMHGSVTARRGIESMGPLMAFLMAILRSVDAPTTRKAAAA